MDKAFRGLIGNECFIYIDDIVVFGRRIKEHNQNLIKVFEKIKELGPKLEPTKFEYLIPELEYLGHLISK